MLKNRLSFRGKLRQGQERSYLWLMPFSYGLSSYYNSDELEKIKNKHTLVILGKYMTTTRTEPVLCRLNLS